MESAATLYFSIWVGFHVGFRLPGYGRGHHGHCPCWVPCKLVDSGLKMLAGLAWIWERLGSLFPDPVGLGIVAASRMKQAQDRALLQGLGSDKGWGRTSRAGFHVGLCTTTGGEAFWVPC